MAAFHLDGRQQNLGRLEVVAVRGQSFLQALHITTMPGATAEANVQAVAQTREDVHPGDVVLAHFWLRSVDSMTGDAYTSFEFETNDGIPENGGELRISSGMQWKECFLPFKISRLVAAGAARVAFRAGFDRQSMEIGGIEITDFGPAVRLQDLPCTRVTYPGREPDAPWRAAALERIDKIRKGDLTITVTDAAGAPIPGAAVRATLRRGDFGFGTCVVANDLLGNSADDQRYRQTILSMFNIATFENEMKWYATWDGVGPPVDKATDWLIAHGITVRGHNLVWPSWRWSPQQLRAFEHNPPELRRRVANHITEIVTHFRGKLPEWDVVNEVFANHDLVDVLGGRAVLLDWFDLAHRADPSSRLFINDFGIFDGGERTLHRDAYYETIQYLQDQHAPIGGIGIQSHFGSDLPSPEHLLEVLNRFAQLGLPIEATEVSLNLDDRRLQADYLRDYTIALFSHPSVRAVILWGFWSKRHWRPNAALYGDDWSIRPNGQAWVDLIQKQWKTDVQLTADGGGSARTRGFAGIYDITVTAGGKTKALTANLINAGTRLVVRMD